MARRIFTGQARPFMGTQNIENDTIRPVTEALGGLPFSPQRIPALLENLPLLKAALGGLRASSAPVGQLVDIGGGFHAFAKTPPTARLANILGGIAEGGIEGGLQDLALRRQRMGRLAEIRERERLSGLAKLAALAQEETSPSSQTLVAERQARTKLLQRQAEEVGRTRRDKALLAEAKSLREQIEKTSKEIGNLQGREIPKLETGTGFFRQTEADELMLKEARRELEDKKTIVAALRARLDRIEAQLRGADLPTSAVAQPSPTPAVTTRQERGSADILGR